MSSHQLSFYYSSPQAKGLLKDRLSCKASNPPSPSRCPSNSNLSRDLSCLFVGVFCISDHHSLNRRADTLQVSEVVTGDAKLPSPWAMDSAKIGHIHTERFYFIDLSKNAHVFSS